MNSVPTDPMIGQTLDGRYAIRSRIARGGMAMVYLANDLRLERRVAVKVMHPHLAEDENFTRRFEQEARSAAGLSHPNLVGVFDQGHDSGRTYLVMEYLPSITLRDLLKQQKRLTAEQATEIGEAVLSGLAAAHSAGIVHRDLKPENVLLADDGRIKLGDFGLARAVSANTTTGQALLGTIAYLSPELVTRGVADARSDLYAFGIMLYEMLTGEQPFTGEQPMQIAYQHAHSEVPAPYEKSAEASPELDELVRWTTQRDPEARPRDAGEALEYLSSLRQGLAVPQHTRVLPQAETSVLATPSTSVLAPAQSERLAAGEPAAAETGPVAPPATPADRAAGAARKRAVRGRVIAAVAIVLIVLAGGVGWWFGQGPGSKATVPDVEGSDMAAAIDLLASHDLTAEEFECPSLEVPAGQAARTEPEAGSRIDRGSAVRLCRSTGPEQLPVPTIVGLPVAEAETTIADAGFTFGEVIEKRFGDAPVDSVVAALDDQGNALGESYAERGTVDLILSAGPVPDVAGLSTGDATSTLSQHDLAVDPSLNAEEHHADIAEGQVIGVVAANDPLRPGDSVGLRLSLGPELFEVPSVVGMSAREAISTLQQAGFAPQAPITMFLGRPISESDWDDAEVTSTDPKAGSRVRAGTPITIRAAV